MNTDREVEKQDERDRLQRQDEKIKIEIKHKDAEVQRKEMIEKPKPIQVATFSGMLENPVMPSIAKRSIFPNV